MELELAVVEKKLEILAQIYEKLSKEREQFEQEIMRKEKQDVYRASYPVAIVQNIYDMLMANAENFSASTWTAILKADNILDLLYRA